MGDKKDCPGSPFLLGFTYFCGNAAWLFPGNTMAPRFLTHTGRLTRHSLWVD
jgi:hypothetical protein